MTIRIAVIGDVFLDHYIYGSMARPQHESAAHDFIFDMESESWTLGGAANTAANIASLLRDEGNVLLCGPVIAPYYRNDEGEAYFIEGCVLNLLDKHDVEVDPVIYDGFGIKTRYIVDGKQVFRCDEDEKCDGEGAVDDICDIVKSADLVVVSDYNKGMVSSGLVSSIRVAVPDVKIIVDPKGDDFTKYRGADIITPNQKEAIEAAGMEGRNHVGLLGESVQFLEEQTGANVVVTLGGGGAVFSGDVFLSEYVPPERCHPTGAGDSFVAGLAAAIVRGEPLDDAVRYANRVASIAVTRLGTAVVYRKELEQANE